jgi:hypothetical protein
MSAAVSKPSRPGMLTSEQDHGEFLAQQLAEGLPLPDAAVTMF